MKFPLPPGAALVACALSACVLTRPVHAQNTPAASQQAALTYDLPAAPLADTLSRISLQSGKPISAGAELVAGKQAAPVRGVLSAEAAARQAPAEMGLPLCSEMRLRVSARGAAGRSYARVACCAAAGVVWAWTGRVSTQALNAQATSAAPGGRGNFMLAEEAVRGFRLRHKS